MDILLISICILLLIAVIVLSALLLLYIRQIHSFSEQVQFIQENETNLKITSQITSKSVCGLLENINHLLEQHQKIERFTNRTNTNFRQTITNLSHDIRTPLTSANGYIQILQSGKCPPEKEMAYLRIIEERLYYVQKLSEQLFEFVRIESEELELKQEKVNLNNVLRDTLSLYYHDFSRKRTEPEIIIPDKSFHIIGDKNAISRIFSNILSNALIHGRDHYTIISQNVGHEYQILFQNSTDSIEAADIEYLFDRFFTSDVSRSKKTTGLGLSIAKRLTLKMNGKISADLQGDLFSIKIIFPVQSS